MKKVLFSLLLLCSIGISAQNTITYDSLENISKENSMLLVGQELYVNKGFMKLGYASAFYKYPSLKKIRTSVNQKIKDYFEDNYYNIIDYICVGKDGYLVVARQIDNKKYYLYTSFADLYKLLVMGYWKKMNEMYLNNIFYVDKINQSLLYANGYNIKSEKKEYGDLVSLYCTDILWQNEMIFIFETNSKLKLEFNRFQVSKYLLSKYQANNIIQEWKLSQKKEKVEQIKRDSLNKQLLLKTYKLYKGKMLYNFGKRLFQDKNDKLIWLDNITRFEMDSISINYISDDIQDIDIILKYDSGYVKLSSNIDTFSGKISYIDKHFIIGDPNKKYPGIKNWQLIKKGKVKLGMSKQEATLSWGKPKDINRTQTYNGTHEQWVYDDGYLYFENGKLTAIQD